MADNLFKSNGPELCLRTQTLNIINNKKQRCPPPTLILLSFSMVLLLRAPPLSFYLPLSLLPPAQESISTGSISWHEYSLPAESLVGESRRLRLRRRQWRGREGRRDVSPPGERHEGEPNKTGVERRRIVSRLESKELISQAFIYIYVLQFGNCWENLLWF